MPATHGNRTHGDTVGRKIAPEFLIWCAMRRRCSNPHVETFKYYGGRGIRVCDRWERSYADFLADMGRRPSAKHSLDRIDVNGHYEPSNCRWADKLSQSNNTRANRRLEFRGESKTIREWERSHQFKSGVLHRRLVLGWSVERALTTPVRHHRPPRPKT